jgi:CheY-like chemotaxis protein
VALADPTSAGEAARNETPDLILLDVQMTPISGKEVMRDIKATAELSDLPVAFFTGTDDPQEKRELGVPGRLADFQKTFLLQEFCRPRAKSFSRALEKFAAAPLVGNFFLTRSTLKSE